MSSIFSRRNLLIGAGAFAVTAGASYQVMKNLNPAGGRQFASPQVLESKGGVLELDLKLAKVDKPLGRGTVTMLSYNGTVPGPTIKVRPGDTLKVNLVNNLDEASNLHTHGLFVHPNNNSDNPFVHVMPGETFNYQFDIPNEHTEGTHWYHPHLHGQVANQVFGGLYGTIIVEDETTPKVSEDRVLVISDSSFNQDGTVASANMMGLMMGREGDLVMVNGEVQPKGETKENALERWRIVNACVARYLSLSVNGGAATLLGLDGHKLDEAKSVDTIVLAPGNRADLLVSVKSNSVSLDYTTVAHLDAGMGMMGMSSQTYDNYPLFTLKTSGTAEIIAAAPKFKPEVDLRTATVTGKRKFVLAMPTHSMAMGASSMIGMFTINGEAFDHEKINTTVSNNSVEEWTIVNTSTMQHPFHLHIWPMQVISVAGQEVTEARHQDVVTVPANSEVVVRVNFNTHTGRTLYHCHILDHEDLGMMGVIESV